MTTFFYGLFAVFVFIFGLGILGPTLISSASDIGVMLGMATYPFTLLAIWIMYKSWAKTVEGQIVLNKLKG